MMERAKKLLQLAFLLLTDLKSFQLGVWEFVWLKRLGGFKEYRNHSSIKLLTARWYLKMMLRKLGSGSNCTGGTLESRSCSSSASRCLRKNL